MNAALTYLSKFLLLVLLMVGCSGSPTGPLSETSQTNPAAAPVAPSTGARITVETTGQNAPAQLGFFVCRNPAPSTSLEKMIFLCRLASSGLAGLGGLALSTVDSNGSVSIGTDTGIWRVGLVLPGNCQPIPPYGEFFNHSLLSPSVTVLIHGLTPVIFSITCV